METFQPSYIEYKNRIKNGLIRILITTLLLTMLLFFSGIRRYWLTAISVFSVLFLLNFYFLVKRNKRYLKSIKISEDGIEAVIVEKDKEFIVSKSSLEDTRIKVFELTSLFTRFGRNFKLQIDLRQNGKFVTLHEQHELGKWSLDEFKDIYTAYCKMKKIPYSLASLKRSNF